jgi:hypothetical protein
MTHLNLDYPASLLLFVRRFYRSVPVYTEPLFRFPPKRVWVQPGIGVRFTPESGFGIIPEWGFGMLRNTHQSSEIVTGTAKTCMVYRSEG